jgi:ADP-heptose:LPS heptosyltransferase
VAALGLVPVDERQLDIPQGWREVGRERLAKAKIKKTGASRVVAVYAGQADGPLYKPWPADRFEEVLRELRRAHPDWFLVILATLDDLWSAVLLFEKTGKIHPVIGADLGLGGFCGLLTQIDLLIAAESWPLRLAAALGTPCLGLYENAARAPKALDHRVLEGLPIHAISVEKVLEAAV